jgi:hypothetical protein
VVTLEGPKAGSSEIFVDNLPGFPDNIRYDKINKVYWIGFSGKRSQPFSLIDALVLFFLIFFSYFQRPNGQWLESCLQKLRPANFC